MERWNIKKQKYTESAKIDKFLADIVIVCQNHGLSIAHEDGSGSFYVEKFYQGNIDMLNSAHDNTCAFTT